MKYLGNGASPREFGIRIDTDVRRVQFYGPHRSAAIKNLIANYSQMFPDLEKLQESNWHSHSKS